MIYELHGTRDGKPIQVRIEADSYAAAVARAGRHGIAVDVDQTQPSRAPSPDPAPVQQPSRTATVTATGVVHSRNRRVILWTVGLAGAGVAALLLLLAGGVVGYLYFSRPPTPVAAAQASPTSELVHTARQADGELVPDPGYQWTSASHDAVTWTSGLAHPLHAHVKSANKEGYWNADAGYDFPNKDSLEVQWAAGRRHPDFPNIKSALREGEWNADPGYQFLSTASLTVRWVEGLTNPDHPHILSGDKDGHWRVMAGYHWVHPDDDDNLTVAWTPGAAHPNAAHVVADSSEGTWLPVAGYKWVHPADNDSLAVAWSPGVAHPTAAHVVADTAEGKWTPASGYRFANNTPGDLSVVKSGPSDEQVKSAVAKVIGAAIANAIGQPRDDDGLGMAIVRAAAREARDKAIRSAMDDAFPGERSSTLDAAANLISLGLDGQLTADNWESANAQSDLMRRLRQSDPDVGDAADVAEFVGRVMDAYQRNH